VELRGSGVSEAEAVSLLKDCVAVVTKKHGARQPSKEVVHFSSQFQPADDLEKMFPGLCVCVYVCICVHVWVHIHVHVHVHVCMHMYVDLYVCAYVCRHIMQYGYVYVCVHTCTVCICTCMCMCALYVRTSAWVMKLTHWF